MKFIYYTLVIIGSLLGVVAFFRILGLFTHYISTDKSFVYCLIAAGFLIVLGVLLREYTKKNTGTAQMQQFHKTVITSLWITLLLILILAAFIAPLRGQYLEF